MILSHHEDRPSTPARLDERRDLPAPRSASSYIMCGMTVRRIKPAKKCYGFAALMLFGALGLLIAGCHSLPLRSEPDASCTRCMSDSCSPELAACDADTRCECINRCHATPQSPLMHPDLWCPKACKGRSPLYNAQAACGDAHCAEVCPQYHVDPT